MSYSTVFSAVEELILLNYTALYIKEDSEGEWATLLYEW